MAKVNAALIDYTLDFTAIDLNDRFNRIDAPVDPVSGSFNFSLDTTLGQTTILPVFSALNIAVDSPIEILYLPLLDRLIIGGGNAGFLGNFTNDFIFTINSFSTSPGNTRFEYCVATGCSSGPFIAAQVDLSFSSSAVPEPEMLSVFFLGMLVLYFQRRRFSRGKAIKLKFIC